MKMFMAINDKEVRLIADYNVNDYAKEGYTIKWIDAVRIDSVKRLPCNQRTIEDIIVWLNTQLTFHEGKVRDYENQLTYIKEFMKDNKITIKRQNGKEK